MPENPVDADRIKIIEQYFRKVGAKDTSLTDLFSEDIEFHFPKFGVGHGKAEFAQFIRAGASLLKSLGHNISEFKYIIGGDQIVVEGTEFGETITGEKWPDYDISHGRFCSVFTFADSMITRMYIYVDPDFTSADVNTINIIGGAESAAA